MSVLLIDANKDGKYIFTKDELQELLDKVEQEAFERGMSFERKVQEQKYIYINSPSLNPPNPYVNWNEVTCKSTCTETNPMDIKSTYTTKSTCIGTDPMDMN